MIISNQKAKVDELCINAHSYMIVGINIILLYYTTAAIQLLQLSNQMYLEIFQHVIFSFHSKSVGTTIMIVAKAI